MPSAPFSIDVWDAAPGPVFEATNVDVTLAEERGTRSALGIKPVIILRSWCAAMAAIAAQVDAIFAAPAMPLTPDELVGRDWLPMVERAPPRGSVRSRPDVPRPPPRCGLLGRDVRGLRREIRQQHQSPSPN